MSDMQPMDAHPIPTAENETIPTTSSTTRREFIKLAALAGTGMSAALAACSAPGPGSSGGTITLKHWDWFVAENDWFVKEIELFQQANPDIKIKRTVQVWDKYPDLLNFAVKGNNMPDIYQIPYNPVFEDQVKQKWLYPLSSFSDFPDFVKTYPKPELTFVKGSNISLTTGKTYSAPLQGPSVVIVTWINSKIFKEAGLVDSKGEVLIPNTLDDMLDYSRTIKKQSGGKYYGHAFAGKTTLQYLWLMDFIPTSSSNGSLGGLNYHSGQFDFYDNPVYHQSVDWFMKMKSEGHLLPDSNSVDEETIRFLFSQDKMGMLFSGTWAVGGWQQKAPDFTQYTVGTQPLIGTTVPRGAYYTQPGGVTFGISAKGKHQEAAWRWYKWLHGKDAAERWVKLGLGPTAHPEANREDLIQNPSMKKIMTMSKELIRVQPSLAVRNPETGKVLPAVIQPDEVAVVQGTYTSQIKDYMQALKGVQDKKMAALEQAVKDAIRGGARVSLDDWKFPDWDPTKDYITRPNS